MATVVYRCSKVLNPLSENQSGYKLKPRETHQPQEDNKGKIGTPECNKNKSQHKKKRTI